MIELDFIQDDALERWKTFLKDYEDTNEKLKDNENKDLEKVNDWFHHSRYVIGMPKDQKEKHWKGIIPAKLN